MVPSEGLEHEARLGNLCQLNNDSTIEDVVVVGVGQPEQDDEGMSTIRIKFSSTGSRNSR